MGGIGDAALGIFSPVGGAVKGSLDAQKAAGAAQEAGFNRALDVTEANQQRAIEAQREQTQAAIDFLTGQANQAREDLQPFRDAQVSALGQLQGLADPNSELFQQQRERGTQAVQRQLAAQGLLRSGAQGNQLGNLELGLNQQRQAILSQLAGGNAGSQFANVSTGLGQGVANARLGLGQGLGSTFQNTGSQLSQLNVGLGGAQALPSILKNNMLQSLLGGAIKAGGFVAGKAIG